MGRKDPSSQAKVNIACGYEIARKVLGASFVEVRVFILVIELYQRYGEEGSRDTVDHAMVTRNHRSLRTSYTALDFVLLCFHRVVG